MTIIKCPKCNRDTPIDIAKSISDDGEVFMCIHCQWPFRYVEK